MTAEDESIRHREGTRCRMPWLCGVVPWRNRLSLAGGGLILALALLAGCSGFIWATEDPRRADLGVSAQGTSVHAALLRDTIGAYGYFEGMGSLPVRGYGLVIGLGENGSRDCPKKIREQLVEAMYRHRHGTERRVGRSKTTPEKLIDSLDSAVVMVQGAIPPAAVAGTRMDVALMALPGTQTKSLRGGYLHCPVELKRFRVSSPRSVITGKTLARAAGPLFLNPFSDEASATQANPREGMILGGGIVTEAREVRLVLTEASYSRAIQIRDRINAHFGGARRAADAPSPSFVELRIPPEFEEYTAHFLVLVRSLYLARDAQIDAMRAQRLGDAMHMPNAEHGRLALCMEGIGRPALPVLSELYIDPDEDVSFAAAAAGLRLDDHLACDAVERHAQNERGEHRFQAIRALGEAQGMASAAMGLRKLLDDDDPRVQIAAYEALLERGDVTISSRRIGGDNFLLDRVPGRAGRFVYVKRSKARRIALFGRDLRSIPPVLYRAPDGSITVTARAGDEELTLLRGIPDSDAVSPPIPAPLDLAGLIELMGNDPDKDQQGNVTGLGLDYGAVVRALYHMCTDQSVDARFILEQPNALELFGQPREAGRPESES